MHSNKQAWFLVYNLTGDALVVDWLVFNFFIYVPYDRVIQKYQGQWMADIASSAAPLKDFLVMSHIVPFATVLKNLEHSSTDGWWTVIPFPMDVHLLAGLVHVPR